MIHFSQLSLLQQLFGKKRVLSENKIAQYLQNRKGYNVKQDHPRKLL